MISFDTFNDCPVVLDWLVPSFVEWVIDSPSVRLSLVLVPTVLESEVPVVLEVEAPAVRELDVPVVREVEVPAVWDSDLPQLVSCELPEDELLEDFELFLPSEPPWFLPRVSLLLSPTV